VDDVFSPKILGSIDLVNSEDGYQDEHIDMCLFAPATHMSKLVRQTLKDKQFDSDALSLKT
jgi:hypothetical protein